MKLKVFRLWRLDYGDYRDCIPVGWCHSDTWAQTMETARANWPYWSSICMRGMMEACDPQ